MDLVGSELLIPSIARAGAPFGPRALFAGGVPGVLIDGFDVDRLAGAYRRFWQDAITSTPATASGDVVGGILDESQGFAVSGELVTGGSLNVNLPFTRAQASGTNTPIISTDNVDDRGARYKWSVSVSGFSGTGTVQIKIGGSSTSCVVGSINGNGTFSGENNSFDENNLIQLTWSGAVTATIDSISIKNVAGNNCLVQFSSSRPKVVNVGGLWCLNMDAIDDYMRMGVHALGADSTLVIAYERPTSEYAANYITGSGGSGDAFRLSWIGDTVTFMRSSGALVSTVSVSGVTGVGPIVVAARHNAAQNTAQLTVNGVTSIVAYGTPYIGNADMFLGARASPSITGYTAGRYYGIVLLSTVCLGGVETVRCLEYVGALAGVTL